MYSTATAPPGLLYLIALKRRLIRTCLTRVRSALTKQGISNRGNVMPMPRFCACGSIMARHSSMTSASETGSRDSVTLPDSISARSRISLISSSRYQPALRIWSMFRFCEGVGGGEPGFHELGETEDRIERRAQLMAHAGEKIRFRAVGLLRGGHGLVQFRFDALAHGIVGADQQVSDDRRHSRRAAP